MPMRRVIQPYGLALAVLACLVFGSVQAADKGPRHHARGEYDTVTYTYVVVEGDDLVAISERFEIPVEDLKAQNQLSSNELKPGQKLVVATTGGPDSPPAKPYKMTTPIPASIPMQDRLDTRFGTLNVFDGVP